jgi:Putative zinc-finger
MTMNTLNCKRTKRMVPLYVGGDLSLDEDRAIAGHLAVCGTCRQLAEEFRQSQNFLTEESASPAFEREFYEEIRHAVLAEIALKQDKWKSFLRPRWIYAMTIVVLFVGFAFFLSRWHVPAQKPVLANTPKSRSESDRNQVVISVPKVSRKELHPRLMTELRPAKLVKAARKQMQIPRGTASLASASLASNSTSRAELSRIEIQTGNPNIRIIWLVQEDGRAVQSDTREKDEHRNRE